MTGGGTVQTAGVPTLALDFKGKVPFSFLTARLAAQGLSLSGGQWLGCVGRAAILPSVVELDKWRRRRRAGTGTPETLDPTTALAPARAAATTKGAR